LMTIALPVPAVTIDQAAVYQAVNADVGERRIGLQRFSPKSYRAAAHTRKRKMTICRATSFGAFLGHSCLHCIVGTTPCVTIVTLNRWCFEANVPPGLLMRCEQQRRGAEQEHCCHNAKLPSPTPLHPRSSSSGPSSASASSHRKNSSGWSRARSLSLSGSWVRSKASASHSLASGLRSSAP